MKKHNQSKITQAIEYLTETHNAEFANEYGEPGYTQPARGVILANWNNIPRGLGDWLEACGYSLEWSDEWVIDYECGGKAWRTQPDSYSWRCSVVYTDDGEMLTPDDGPEQLIEWAEMTAPSQPARCVPHWVEHGDLEAAGFEPFKMDAESGFHPGQNDDPQTIARRAFGQGAEAVIFRISEASQFYSRFECFARFDCPYFDRFDICAAYSRIEADYNVSGWLRERPSNQRRKESTGCQLARMQYSPGMGDDMTPNAWAIYRTLQRRYGFEQGV